MRAPAVILLAVLAAASACGRPALTPTESAGSAVQERVGAAADGGPVYCRRDRVCGSDVLPAFYKGPGVPPGLDRRPPLARPGPRLSRGPAPRRARTASTPRTIIWPLSSRCLAGIDKAAPKGLRRVPARRPGRPRNAPDRQLSSSAPLTSSTARSIRRPSSRIGRSRGGSGTWRPSWRRAWRTGTCLARWTPCVRRTPCIRGCGKPSGNTDRSRPPAAGRDSRPDRSSSKGTGTPASTALRETLAAMGELSGAGTPGRSGPFRRRSRECGPEASSAATASSPTASSAPATAFALNVSAAERLEQIRANLERWRWITQDLGERYILINVADFRVAVYEAGREVLSMAGHRRPGLPPDARLQRRDVDDHPQPRLERSAEAGPRGHPAQGPEGPGLSQEKGLPGLQELDRERPGDRPGRRRLAPVRRGPDVLSSSARIRVPRTRSAGSCSCSPTSTTSTSTIRPSAGFSAGPSGISARAASGSRSLSSWPLMS